MASSILNSDDGVISGTSGLKTSGGDDGILKIQTNGTDAVSVTGSQVCSFANNFGTVANLPAYQCRAWVNFDGTGTVAIRASGNVTSITDNGTGDYTVNFTTAMPDANYSLSGSVKGNTTTNYAVVQIASTDGSSSSSVRVHVFAQSSGSPALSDRAIVDVSIFR
jgi:hypothetical protein